MDNFMDKIAQKLNAQEMIRANSAADAAQMEKLQAQNEEYEACMKEIRKLNLRTMENEQRFKEELAQLFTQTGSDLKSLTQECLLKLQKAEVKSGESEDTKKTLQELKRAFDEQQEALAALKAAFEGQQETLEQLKTALDRPQEKLEELFRQSDDFAHKESVKVYRNVQAVVVEELGKQTQTLTEAGTAAAGREKNLLIVGGITLAAALVNIGILIVHILGVF